MLTLNLINGTKSDLLYQAMVFPDGQPHLKLDLASLEQNDKGEPIRILSRASSANDLLLLLFAKNALDYQEFSNVELHLSYLLSARMDRVMLEGEPFSLKVVAAMLNGAAFKKIKIFDPHSEVSTALIDRSYAVTNHVFVRDAIEHYLAQHQTDTYSIISPDAGALKKINKLAVFLGITNIVECMKERNLKTGALTSFKTAAGDLSGQTCFIVDDICDGGGTFAGTAKMLKEKGARNIVLIVSHGIFSKGTTIPGIDAIYTTDSYKVIDGVNCFSIEDYL